jgi:hypothetical protein
LAHQRELLHSRGWRWLLVALLAAQALPLIGQFTVVYKTSLALPSSGLITLSVLLFALRAARPAVHPALRGFRRPLPPDGLALIDTPPARRPYVLRFTFLLPALALLLYLAQHQPLRWLDCVLLGLMLTAPLWLIPYKQLWLAPAWLALPWVIWLGQAWAVRATLPPEAWAAPITGARCAGPLTVIRPEAQAWCLNAFTHHLYRFDLNTGRVTLSVVVPEGARVFAATAAEAWIQQHPARGLVRVNTEGQTPIPAYNAHTGAASPDGRLWVIDVGQELTAYLGEVATPLRARDGLLNNTANVVKVSPAGEVWVGSISGVSVLRAGRWETYGHEQGVPGAVINLAFAEDGSVWLAWQARPGYSARSNWGVSQLLPDGSFRHMDLGGAIGLEPPRAEEALAVDGAGRLWFVTQTIPQREKFLGMVEDWASPTTAVPIQLYSLGHLATTGPYAYGGNLWHTTYGVLADGGGGVIVFNGEAEVWQRWRP